MSVYYWKRAACSEHRNTTSTKKLVFIICLGENFGDVALKEIELKLNEMYATFLYISFGSGEILFR